MLKTEDFKVSIVKNNKKNKKKKDEKQATEKR